MAPASSSSSQLYVFETTMPNGFIVRGSAGLSLQDMESLKTFYSDTVSGIVLATNNTPQLKIHTPVVPKSRLKKNRR